MSIVPMSYADLEQNKINAINILWGKSQPGGEDLSKSSGSKSDRPTIDELSMMSTPQMKKRTGDQGQPTKFYSRGSQRDESATPAAAASVSLRWAG